MYLFYFLDVIGKRPHKLESFPHSFVVLESTGVQKTSFVFHLSSGTVSGGFFLVDYSPFLLMCRCPIVVFIDISICIFINHSVRPGHVLRKPSLIALRGLVISGLKSVSCQYCASSSLVVWDRILFGTIFIVMYPVELSTLLLFVTGTFYYLLLIILDCHFLLVYFDGTYIIT